MIQRRSNGWPRLWNPQGSDSGSRALEEKIKKCCYKLGWNEIWKAGSGSTRTDGLQTFADVLLFLFNVFWHQGQLSGSKCSLMYIVRLRMLHDIMPFAEPHSSSLNRDSPPQYGYCPPPGWQHVRSCHHDGWVSESGLSSTAPAVQVVGSKPLPYREGRWWPTHLALRPEVLVSKLSRALRDQIVWLVSSGACG